MSTLQFYHRPGKPGIQVDNALNALNRGIETFIEPLAQTLGPAKSMVLNDRGNGQPEFLSNSATIAERMIELPTRAENVGAMMARQMVWQVHEQHGDGAATAAVLTRAILRGGRSLIAAGMNPALIRSGIERGVASAIAALSAQAVPAEGEEVLGRLATSITGDATIGRLLGELLDQLGEHAAVITEDALTPEMDREYVRGGLWDAVPADRLLIPEGMGSIRLQKAQVAIIDEEVERAEQVQRLLELAVATPGKPPLLILAREIKGEALNMLTTNHVRGILTIAAATLATARLTLSDDFADIATLTGAQILSQEIGQSPQHANDTCFGQVREATISHRTLLLVDGAGQAQHIKQRISILRARMKHTRSGDEDQTSLRMRIARLAGGVGVLKVGGHTEHERDLRKEQAQKAIGILGRAREEGVVPGGGVAYLACQEAVRAAAEACIDRDEASGIALVANALEAPFFQLVRNRGDVDPPVALMRVRDRGAGYGLDVMTNRYICMAESGIMDSLNVACGALQAGASLAAMALTTDTIIFT